MNSIPIPGSSMFDLLICQPNPVDFKVPVTTSREVAEKYVLYER